MVNGFVRTVSLAAASVVLALVLVEGVAAGATTVGRVPEQDPGTSGNYNVVGMGAPWRITVPGVVVSWQVRGSENSRDAGSSAALNIWRETGDPASPPLTAALASTTDHEDVRPGVNTFPAAITVAPGDLLGIATYSLGGSTPGEGVACGTDFDVRRPIGQDATFTCAGDVVANVAAVIEPDGDGDLFGDETQDRCLARRGTDNGCPELTAAAARSAARAAVRRKSSGSKVTATTCKSTAAARWSCTVKSVRRKKRYVTLVAVSFDRDFRVVARVTRTRRAAR